MNVEVNTQRTHDVRVVEAPKSFTSLIPLTMHSSAPRFKEKLTRGEVPTKLDRKNFKIL